VAAHVGVDNDRANPELVDDVEPAEECRYAARQRAEPPTIILPFDQNLTPLVDVAGVPK
jgi:hypothetical protein